MKGYLDAKELESYKKEDLQELAKQLGVDAEGRNCYTLRSG